MDDNMDSASRGPSVVEEIERYAALLERGLLTADEFERRKASLLAEGVSDGHKRLCPYCSEAIPLAASKCKHCGSVVDTDRISRLGSSSNKYTSHGVIVVVGSGIVLLCAAGLLSDDVSPKDKLNEFLGILVMLSAWIIPHSVWIFNKPTANKILPTVALALLGFSALAYIGSL